MDSFRAVSKPHLVLVVQKVDNAIHKINLYPLDSTICFHTTYSLHHPVDNAIQLLNNRVQIGHFCSHVKCYLYLSLEPNHCCVALLIEKIHYYLVLNSFGLLFTLYHSFCTGTKIIMVWCEKSMNVGCFLDTNKNKS